MRSGRVLLFPVVPLASRLEPMQWVRRNDRATFEASGIGACWSRNSVQFEVTWLDEHAPSWLGPLILRSLRTLREAICGARASALTYVRSVRHQRPSRIVSQSPPLLYRLSGNCAPCYPANGTNSRRSVPSSSARQSQ